MKNYISWAMLTAALTSATAAQQSGTMRPAEKAPGPSTALSYCNWNGGFETPFGRLNLAHRNNIVTGTYAKVGFIAGVLDGQCKLKGHFTNSGAKKYGTFEFTPTNEGFTGSWKWYDSPDRKAWTGKRINSRAGGGALPNKPKCNWTGTFGGTAGTLTLTQTGSSVKGLKKNRSPLGPKYGSTTFYTGKVDNNCVLRGSYTRNTRTMLKSTWSKGTIQYRLYGDVFAGMENHEGKGDVAHSGARISGWGAPTPVGGE